MGRNEWERFKVGKKSDRQGWTEPGCQSFSEVYHVTHIKDAIRIIEDGVIRSSLVWDESKLNNTRTCVSWVSPNTWTNGSIYGNISFKFDWATLVEGKRLYWVEAMDAYSPPAYRILITEKDCSDQILLKPYPYETKSGPIYFDGDDWYRNGHYTGEFLIDGDLDLNSCQEIEYVDHHPSACSKDKGACEDLGLSRYVAGSMFVANIIGRDLTEHKSLLCDRSETDCIPTFNTQGAINRWFLLFGKRCSSDKSSLSIEEKILITKACLTFYSEDKREFMDSLVKLLGDKEETYAILEQTVEQYFGVKFKDISDW